MKVTNVFAYDSIRWTIEEISFPENAKESAKLMKLVKSGKGFDIGWVGLKKEIVSFNIRREKKGMPVTVSVCASMDDFPELLADADFAMKSEKKGKKYKELTSEEVDAIMDEDEYAWQIDEVETEVTHSKEIGNNPSLAGITEGLMQVWGEAKAHLNEGFETVKNIVRSYKAENR